MKFEIEPYVGVGSLRFGMDRTTVRQVMGAPSDVTHRGEYSVEKDIFVKIGLLASYDQDDRLEAVEFADPAEPMLAGVNLLGESANVVKALLQLVGGDLNEHRDGAGSRKLGMQIWIPHADEADKPAHSILVASHACYAKYPPEFA